jgi:hypothetical protein
MAATQTPQAARYPRPPSGHSQTSRMGGYGNEANLSNPSGVLKGLQRVRVIDLLRRQPMEKLCGRPESEEVAEEGLASAALLLEIGNEIGEVVCSERHDKHREQPRARRS